MYFNLDHFSNVLANFYRDNNKKNEQCEQISVFWESKTSSLCWITAEDSVGKATIHNLFTILS